MKITTLEIPDLLILEPTIYDDARGYFFESYKAESLDNAGYNINFIQDNQAKSTRGVLRGLHLQTGEYAQTKLIRALHGEILDVAVDLRKNSPTYGRSYSIILSATNRKQLLIPKGFAHGYAVLSANAEVFYKVDAPYAPRFESGILYNDPTLNIDWLLHPNEIILSSKDALLPYFNEL